MVGVNEILPVYYIIAASGVLIAAIYYVMNLRTTIQTRQAQLFMPLYSTYYNDDFIKAFWEIMEYQYKDYDDFQSKYSYNVNPEAYTMYRKVFGYLEGVGVLVRRRLIDPSLVDDLMSGMVINYWEKFEPFIVEYRKRADFPQIGEQIEFLYNQIKPIAERQKKELQKGLNS